MAPVPFRRGFREDPTILDYLRVALSPKPGLKPGETFQVLPREIPAAAASEAALSTLRRLALYPDDGCMPLTWPLIATFRSQLACLVDPSFPLPAMGTLHLGVEILQHRPIGAGEALAYRVGIGGLREAASGLSFDVTVTGLARGEVVWEGRSTMMRRWDEGHRIAPWPPPLKPAALWTLLKGLAKPSAPTRPAPTSPHFNAGETSPAGRNWDIDLTVARAMARLSGDLNPIHLANATARLFGLRRAIIHGSLTATFAAALAPALHSRRNLRLSCQFRRPIFLPAQVHGLVAPVAAVESMVDLTVRSRTGEHLHLKGRMAAQASPSHPDQGSLL